MHISFGLFNAPWGGSLQAFDTLRLKLKGELRINQSINQSIRDEKHNLNNFTKFYKSYCWNLQITLLQNINNFVFT